MKKIINSKEEFLALLKNDKKIENCRIENICLSGKDFGTTLLEYDIECIKFIDVDFCKTKFYYTSITHCLFQNVNFDQVFLSDFRFDHCNFDNVKFTSSCLISTKYHFCLMSYHIFEKCTFSSMSEFTFCKMIAQNIYNREFFEDCLFYAPLKLINSALPGPYISKDPEDLKKMEFFDCDAMHLMHPILHISPIGSRDDCTIYIPCIDWVQCGCWRDTEDNPDPDSFIGGHLKAFKKRVETVYPEGKYHDQYMVAIELFEVYKRLYFEAHEEEAI